jgi:methionyl-tRNA synthetase
LQRGLSFAFTTFNESIPGVDAPYDQRDTEFIAAVNKFLTEYNAAMEAVNMKQGLKLVMELSSEANKYQQVC